MASEGCDGTVRSSDREKRMSCVPPLAHKSEIINNAKLNHADSLEFTLSMQQMTLALRLKVQRLCPDA